MAKPGDAYVGNPIYLRFINIAKLDLEKLKKVKSGQGYISLTKLILKLAIIVEINKLPTRALGEEYLKKNLKPLFKSKKTNIGV
jgi:hypothetical protein